ncbi:MAG TPA: glycosyltransferase [Bacteroidia bacterium]|nr:glycosyltransferase [Bacteroidia bacterium]HNT79531.1 glycosyltransferase [Bacteroidia bacterium]
MNSEKRVVLFLTKWYPNDEDPQLGVFIQKQALALQHDFNVFVLCVQSDAKSKGNKIFWNKNQKISEVCVQYSSSAIKTYRLVQNINAWNTGIQAIEKVAGKIDIIHAHILLRPAWIALRAAASRNIPFFISEHWTGFATGAYKRKNALYKQLSKRVCSKAKAVAVVSEQLKMSMRNNGIEANYHVIPNVVEFSNQVKRVSHNASKKIILTVADLYDANKNISASIRAMSEIAKERADFEFHIIGGGPDEVKLHQLSDKLGLRNVVVFFHGRLPNNEVLSYIPSCHFLLINSRIETFSVSAIEALVSGKPVLTTICGGPENFIHKGNGLTIEQDDSAELIRSIHFMLDHHQQYDSSVISNEIKETYSPLKIAEQISNMYAQI